MSYAKKATLPDENHIYLIYIYLVAIFCASTILAHNLQTLISSN
jgi:hypothetical protein